MEENARKLLDDHGIVILPEEIDHDTFVLVLEATLIRKDAPITLHCHGEGGDSCVAGAIVDIIRHHGRVRGVLAGDANSCHGVIFASCTERYVYPGGRVGIHRVSQTEIRSVTADYAEGVAKLLESHDRRNAKIFASACRDQHHWHEAFWFEVIRVNPRALHHFDASFLIECGMARPISEMK